MLALQLLPFGKVRIADGMLVTTTFIFTAA